MFENYNDEELFNILQNICDKEDYFISDNLKVEIKKHLSRETMHEKKQFSNGRYIRNLFEELIMQLSEKIILYQNT